MRQTGNRLVFGQIRAPSTLGTFLRVSTHGHVQQLKHGAVPIADRPGHGYAKQGGEHGRGKGKKTFGAQQGVADDRPVTQFNA
ncbi:MAG TPA: hypothetical protein VES01_02195 [Dermatophilaceae bacterium]|nr:hypothetical protein [Dermatophilaceae bacterium]